MDAINSSHAAELTEAAATTAHRQLSAYFQRFQSRLAPSNCRHIQTLSRCAQVFCAYYSLVFGCIGCKGTRPVPVPPGARQLLPHPSARTRRIGVFGTTWGSCLTGTRPVQPRTDTWRLPPPPNALMRRSGGAARQGAGWRLAVRQVACRPEEVARLLPPGPTPVPTAGMSRPHSTAQVLSRAASGALPIAPTSASGGAAAGAPGKGHGSSGSGSTGGNGASTSAGVVLTVNDFLLQTGLDNLNLFKLVRLVILSNRFPVLLDWLLWTVVCVCAGRPWQPRPDQASLVVVIGGIVRPPLTACRCLAVLLPCEAQWRFSEAGQHGAT